MLGYKDRMFFHRCLLAILFRQCRGQTLLDKITGVLLDYRKALVLKIGQLSTAKLESTAELRLCQSGKQQF